MHGPDDQGGEPVPGGRPGGPSAPNTYPPPAWAPPPGAPYPPPGMPYPPPGAPYPPPGAPYPPPGAPYPPPGAPYPPPGAPYPPPGAPYPPPGWGVTPPGWPGGPIAPVPPTAPAGLAADLDAGAAPDSRGSAGIWLLVAVAGFVVGQVASLVFLLVAHATFAPTTSLSKVVAETVPPEWYVVASLLGLWVGFGGASWLAVRVRGVAGWARDLGVRFRWADALGILIGLATQITVGLLYLPFEHLHNFQQKFNAPSHKLTGGSHGAGFLLIAVLTVVGAPFFEELFFRGLLLRSLLRLFRGSRAALGAAMAIGVDGVLFGMAHGELIQLPGLALTGAVLALVAYKTGRLGMNMVTHATFNLLAIIAVLHNGGGLIWH